MSPSTVAAFPRSTLELFDREKEVEIETRSARGARHRVIIWIVVVNGVPYVRSVRGERGRWFRELSASREGAILARRRRIPVRARPARAAVAVGKVSEAYRRKYPRSPSTASMVRKEILGTTMRLDPPSPRQRRSVPSADRGSLRTRHGLSR